VAIRTKLNRLSRLALVGLFVFATIIPLLQPSKAAAYTLLPSRSITMDSSAEGDSLLDADNDLSTDGINVTYHVRFDVATDTDFFGGIVVEFCNNSPIIGDTNVQCNDIDTTYAFDIGAPTVSGQSDGVGEDDLPDYTGTGPVTDDCDLSTFTTATALTNHTLALTTASPVDIAPGATCFFDITTITNPNVPNYTFFARIYTYTEAAEANGYTLADPNAGIGTANNDAAVPGTNNDDDFIDAGGIALSTAEQITITAKVPEKLTFCVYTQDGTPSNTCGTGGTAPQGNAIVLGDNNGSLSDVEEFVNTDAKFTISTNALYNVAVRMKGGTLKTTPGCSDDPTQTCSIDSIGGADPGSQTASSAGTEQFGMCTYQSVGAGLTMTVPYDDAECNTVVDNSGAIGNGLAGDAGVPAATFGFFNENTVGTTSTYGDIIATKEPGSYSTGVLAFLGNIAVTTEAGIYTTTLTFIATGTY
jgi:hypothetical protein